MNVRFWPQSPGAGVASTRIRVLQVIDALRELGVDAALFQPGESPRVLVLGKRYDDDTMRQALELRARHGTRIVLDLCDNHFHAESGEARWVQRADRLRKACRDVDQIVTASATLAEMVREHAGAALPVEVIPDALDRHGADPADRRRLAALHALRLRAFDAFARVAPGRRLLWFGNHGSDYAGGGMQDLQRIAPQLSEHDRQAPLSLVVVSNRWRTYREQARGWRWKSLYLPWSGANFALALARSDIALIPAQRNPFTLCKTNNRPATALSHGLAVAADALPSYEELRGMAVLDDWADGLGALMSQPQDRAQRVARAQAFLGRAYGMPAIAGRWQALLQRLAPA